MSIKNISKNEYMLLDVIATLELTPYTPEQCKAHPLDIDLWSTKMDMKHYNVGPLFVKLRDKELVGTIPKDPGKDKYAYCYVTERGFKAWSAIRKILREKNKPKIVSTQKELDKQPSPSCIVERADQIYTDITNEAKKIWGKDYVKGFKNLLEKKKLTLDSLEDQNKILKIVKDLVWLKEQKKKDQREIITEKLRQDGFLETKSKKNTILDRLKKL